MAVTINVNNASFNYGSRNIFSNLNLEISKSEVLCILGPNGCGKTTLLRCISGALKLAKGEVLLEGRSVHTMKVNEVALKIGFVFQEHSAPFPFSVLEVVRMGRTPHLSLFGSPSEKDTKIAEQALETVNMLHYKDTPYTQISGGERQLVLIARTLAQKPDVILMDEPTSHLDFRNQTLILKMVNRLAKQGLAVIMTTHLPDHALLFSSKVALMDYGKFLATGTPDNVMTEDNLRQIYNINVRILSINSANGESSIKLCIPVIEADELIASGLPGIDNVFEGYSEVENGIARIDIGNGIIVEAVSNKSGNVKLYIPSEVIIVSQSEVHSSGRNVVKGKVKKINIHDSTVDLDIDIGHEIKVTITKKSLTEMEIDIGKELCLTFKASAIRLY